MQQLNLYQWYLYHQTYQPPELMRHLFLDFSIWINNKSLHWNPCIHKELKLLIKVELLCLVLDIYLTASVFPTGCGMSLLPFLVVKARPDLIVILVLSLVTLHPNLLVRATVYGIGCSEWSSCQFSSLILVSAKWLNISLFFNYLNSIISENIYCSFFVDGGHVWITHGNFHAGMEWYS